MNIQENQELAFNLHKIIRAWNLHMTSELDAWECNFNVKQSIYSFMTNLRIPRSDENKAMKSVLYLNSQGFDPRFYRDLVVTTSHTPCRDFYVNIKDRLKAFDVWRNRTWETNAETDEGDFVIHNGIPAIMYCVKVGLMPPLLAAEALTNGKSWNHLWSLKEQSTFEFDLVWPQIHKYKPLFEQGK